MDFSKLKANRSASIESLKKQLTEGDKKQFEKDERFWKPTFDKKVGVIEAVIRFLPAPGDEDRDYVKYMSHSIENAGLYYIENCPTTVGIDRECPLCKLNREAWNRGEKKLAQERSRKTNHVCNIMVIDDQQEPSNNGKVFLFRYGKDIQGMIANAMQPQFRTQKELYPFDMWEGADFYLRAAVKGGFWTYDNSSFGEPGRLMGFSDEQLQEVWSKEYLLSEFVSPDKFKSYEALQARLDIVLGNSYQVPAPSSQYSKEPPLASRKPTAPAAPAAPRRTLDDDIRKPAVKEVETPKSDTSSDYMDYFRSLAEDDDIPPF